MKTSIVVMAVALAAGAACAGIEVPFEWSLRSDGTVYEAKDQRVEIDEFGPWTHHAVVDGFAAEGKRLPVRVFLEFEGGRGSYLKFSGSVKNTGDRPVAVDFDGPVFAPWKVTRGRSMLYYPQADGWRIRRFPTVEEVKAAGTGKRLGIFWTVGDDGKVRYANRYDCDYPSRQMTMQYVALSDGKDTWSYVVKDPDFAPKQPLTTFDPATDELSFHFVHRFALRPGEERRLPCVEVLKRKGGWQVAALDYGAWFRENVNRATPPDWVRDSPSFPLVICKQQNGRIIWPFTEFDKLADALERYGANQVQILGRGPGGHDNLYPDYTPDPAMGGEEALVKGLKVLRDRGIRTYAYVNGQLIEKDRTDWWKSGGSTAGVMKPDGTRYGESWWKYKNRGEKAHAFDVACPCAPMWRKRMHEIALDAVRFGFDGLYVDQVGKQRPMFCCDATHDHPANDWVFAQDRVDLMASLRDACRAKNPDFVLETEGYCEPMSGSCSINLGLGYLLNGIGLRFEADGWADAWPEMAFLTDPDYISSDRFASPTRTRKEVNAAAALGYRLDLEVRYATDRVLFETCEHTDYTEYTEEVVDPPWDFSPPFKPADFPKRDLKQERAYIRAVNLFRLAHRDLLLRGRFVDELGFTVKTDATRYTAKRWVSQDGLRSGVLVWNADAEPRTFEVAGCGHLASVCEPEKDSVAAAVPVAPDSIRLYVFETKPERISVVAGGWKFRRGDDPKASEPDYDDSAWTPVELPHDWALAGPFNYSNDVQVTSCAQEYQFTARSVSGRTGALPWLGVGWYRGAFEVPAGVGFAELRIEGAMNEAKVWIDGKLAGERPYGYIPFSVPVPAVPGRHTVAVRLENISNSHRWYPGAGLYRLVRLVTGPALGLAADGTFVSTAYLAADGSARLSVVEQIRGDDRRRGVHDLTVRWRVKDADGRELSVEGGEMSVAEGVANGTLTVKDPVIWSPESPRLVTLVTELYRKGDLIDRRETRFGIRTVRVTPEGFLVNGKPVEIRGAGLHADLGTIGPEFNASAFRRQLHLLREMGCNAIRTAHNPPAPDAMAIADEEGFLVMAEALDMWKSAKVGKGYWRHFEKWGERDVGDLVRLYRNHPSIVMWSIGNEIWENDVRDTVAIGKRFVDIAHRLDPTRPVVQCIDRPGDCPVGYVQQLDLPCINYRVGWDPNEKRFLPDMHRASKSGLVIISEGSSITSSRGVYKFPVEVRTGGHNADGSYEDGVKYPDGHCTSYDVESMLWGNPPDADFAAVERYPWLIGQFAWHGFDYLGEPTPYQRFWPSRSCYFGCFDMGGIPKDRFFLYRAQWNRSSPTLHLLPHWTWPDRVGQVTPVYCYTSWPTAELFVNGKSQGRRTKDPSSRLDRYRLRWNEVVYEPGELKVVAYDADGRAVGEKTVETADAPKRIVLEPEKPYRPELEANYPYAPLRYVRIRIVDGKGRLCPDADNEVSVTVSGGGAFKTLCNGDPTSLESLAAPHMKVFHGEMMLTVKVTDPSRPITVTATAAGLEPATSRSF